FTACGANCPMKRNGPSHVPVTSTRVMVAVVQSPRAHPRLKSVSTIMNAPVHLLLVSPAHGHGSKRRRGDHISESERDREHAIACATPASEHPWLRINRVLRVMLQTRWSAEAWSQVRVEFRRALALRSEIRRAARFN